MSLDTGCSVRHQRVRFAAFPCPLCKAIEERNELAQIIGRFAIKLANAQRDLSPEDAALLYGNLWKLYGPSEEEK